jgi:hypothetical protein
MGDATGSPGAVRALARTAAGARSPREERARELRPVSGRPQSSGHRRGRLPLPEGRHHQEGPWLDVVPHPCRRQKRTPARRGAAAAARGASRGGRAAAPHRPRRGRGHSVFTTRRSPGSATSANYRTQPRSPARRCGIARTKNSARTRSRCREELSVGCRASWWMCPRQLAA